MNDAGAVRTIESRRDLDRVLEGLVRRERSFGEASRQRFTFQVLHDEEVEPILRADVVQDANVRVVERRDRASLALEALAQIPIVRHASRKDFDGDDAIETRVARAIDLAHATGAKERAEFVRTDAPAFEGWGHACCQGAAADSSSNG